MKISKTLTCATFVAGLASFAVALTAAPQEKPPTSTIQVKTVKLMRVGSDLVGRSLVNQKNEPLGKVEDIIVHPKGDIAFVEFSGAGSLKTGLNRYPVPWRALARNDDGQFVLDATPESFAKSPCYDKKPDLTAMSWWSETDAAYSKHVAAKSSPVEASASLAPAKMLYQGSDLRSRSIESVEGEKIATMHELVIDPRSGRVAYAVLSVGGAPGTGEKLIAVPWETLKSMPDKSNPKLERLTLGTTKEKLAQAPEYVATTEGWQKASEPDYIVKVYEYYAVPPYWANEKAPANK